MPQISSRDGRSSEDIRRDNAINDSRANAFLGGMLVNSLGAGGLNALSSSLYNVYRRSDGLSSLDNLTFDKLKSSKGLSGINIVPGLAPAYDPARKVILGGGGLSALLHELGHASNHQALQRVLGRGGDTAYKLYTNIRHPLAGITGLTGIGMGTWGDEDTRKWAPYVAASGGALMVGEEGLATLRAIRDLKKINGGWWNTIKRGKVLFPALGTYAALPMGAGLAAWYAKHTMDKAEEKYEKGKEVI